MEDIFYVYPPGKFCIQIFVFFVFLLLVVNIVYRIFTRTTKLQTKNFVGK